MGDLGFPMFGLAQALRMSPAQRAQNAAERFIPLAAAGETVTTEGPYINIRLDRAAFAAELLSEILHGAAVFGHGTSLAGRRVMVEFSSPNTNKPLHLGHIRNDILGEATARIMAACGAQVQKVCIINDRGIHICKSMLAYKEQGNAATPQSAGVKSDHFVGGFYVLYHKMEAQDPTAEERARELLRKWEDGDSETVALWRQMNAWTVDGMKETYLRTGVSFDKYYFESETYLKGKEEIKAGLEQGIFSREEDGSVQIDLTDEGLDKKVLLRSDGTSLYITQDIGTAMLRHSDWPFDQLIYVVGSEQNYHFKVLFSILKKLGFDWAQNLYHLSYGMVHLPDGKMKSREGTVVDADDLIDSLRDSALQEIRGKEREAELEDAAATAEKIALGALHYYLLSVSPSKDMLFDPKESLSFNGNTGPYLQYMGTRIASMLRKTDDADVIKHNDINYNDMKHNGINTALLTGAQEWELLRSLAAYPQAVEEAGKHIDPSGIAAYLYELSKAFSRFYHDCPILNAPDAALSNARLALCRATLAVLQDAFNLICIPYLSSM
jgi:arginyl-tRNA synthetase